MIDDRRKARRPVPLVLQGHCRWMLRLVKTDLASAGKPDSGERSPSFFVNLRTLDALLRKCQHLRGQIVTQKIKLVPVILLAGMERRFRGRKRKNQPSMT